jgi:hypothetical protein
LGSDQTFSPTQSPLGNGALMPETVVTFKCWVNAPHWNIDAIAGLHLDFGFKVGFIQIEKIFRSVLGLV